MSISVDERRIQVRLLVPIENGNGIEANNTANKKITVPKEVIVHCSIRKYLYNQHRQPHTFMPARESRRMEERNWTEKEQNKATATTANIEDTHKILTIALNKSIKHQTVLKYDFQPHDMSLDMNSIIITIQNANSTMSATPVRAGAKLSIE